MTLRDERGQSITEFALVLPLFLILILGVVELGAAFDETTTIIAASREGARVAGALANGGGPLGCASGQSPNAATVDPAIVAAVERVLTASGTHVAIADVGQIRIYKATLTGDETATAVNVWTYQLNGGPTIAGEQLDFVQQSQTWPPCMRNNVSPADSAGITVSYTYRSRTPLRYFIPWSPTITVAETTVMSLNATH